MKKTLSHLPQNKQHELNAITERILAFISPAKIILFGSYARGNYKDQADFDPDSRSGHPSDYDILVITTHKSNAKNTTLGKNINDSCQKLELSANPNIITHYLKFVNDKLQANQYFFTDIIKEGVLLYDDGDTQFAEPKELTPAEQKQIAQDYFDNYFKSVKAFYKAFKVMITECEYNNAAFQLNQSAENCYRAILLVFTDYCPREHLLNILGKSCEKFSDELKDIFPTDTKEQKDMFELLNYAYIGARYDKDYKIADDELRYLAKRVRNLHELTERICKEKIENFV